MNNVVLLGRLKERPILEDKKGYKLATMLIEVDRPVKNGEEMLKEVFKILLWKNAEDFVNECQLNNYLAIKGRLQPNNYQRKDGSDMVYSCDIVAEKISIINN